MKDGDTEVPRSVIEDPEGGPCDLCAKPATERTALPWRQIDGSKGVDYACESCRAVLEVAQGVLDYKVEDEIEIVTTIALAGYEGLSWLEKADQSPEDFAKEHPGLAFSRDVDGMPLFRMLPLWVEVVRYDGTDLPKEIKIGVSSRIVTAEEVAALYRQTLHEENIPSNNCVGMCLECSTDDLMLTMTVRPRAQLHPQRVQYVTTYPPGPMYHFPPPNIIRGWCKELLGSVDPRTFRGVAYALGDHDRSQAKSAETNVLACLAWCFGECDDTTRPAERRPRISRTLNRHLLSRSDITELPQESWSSDDAIWRDAKEVAPRLIRASYLWQRSND
jgi:hypothetical protein